ncbi:MAG TPA: 50S ribosomal protein L6 [Desulfobacteraceae bacterium]|nr:50S ribosomal protein L6 [Desulfobacteraceae bacterium]
MSRVGKRPIEIPKGVTVEIRDEKILVKGPKGQLDLKLSPKVVVERDENQIRVNVVEEDRKTKALHGLYRSLIANMVKGVTDGYEKQLEIVGIGYRAEIAGDKLRLFLGYSDPIDFPLPQGISAKVEKARITISGIDKQLVGEVAAEVRALRRPDPYKGKGIRYVDEVIRKKAGKAGAK